MKTPSTIRRNSTKKGVALLIALFALLLISGMALALLFMAGNETFIGTNFKSNTKAFYAAYDGLEEARGRLSPKHPQSIAPLITGLPGGLLAPGQAIYILNPAGGEADVPWNHAAGNPYEDTEYQSEWGNAVAQGNVVGQPNSTFVGGALPGPLFKWVRITAKTERSANIDVDGDGNPPDAVAPIFYDGAYQYLQGTPGRTGQQVFTLTSLAVLPNGSKRIVQSDTSLNLANLQVPSALTFDGPGDTFGSPNSNPFHINGTDRSGPDPGVCASAAQPAVPAVGVVTPGDVPPTIASLNRPDHYTGAGATPSVANVASNLPPSMQSVSALEGLVQNLAQTADYTLTDGGNGTGACTSSPPSLGTATAPVTIYANCSFSLSGSNTGYGVLIVTGTYTASGNNGWRGLVLVVGQGNVQVNGGGNNSYDGAIVVAKTRDASGNLLATLGSPSVNWNGGGGNGIYYDSCWVSKALSSKSNYRVLAFREITQ